MTVSSMVTIGAVGDFMIQQRAEMKAIHRVKALLGDASVKIANLDTVLSDAGQPTPKMSNLRGPREVVDDLRMMGINIVTLANNHAMDYGSEGMLDMCQSLAQAGIEAVGAGENLADALSPVAMSFGTQSVAVIALACTLPPCSSAGPSRPGVAPVTVHQAYSVDVSLAAEQPGSALGVKTWIDEVDLQRACDSIKAARQHVDIVVVVVHWGVPTLWRTPIQPRIQDYQRVLGHALVDAGAHAIIGNHAHELHDIEFYMDRPIVYSLGNFWIDTLSSRPWMGRETIVLKLGFPRTGPAEIEVLPLLLDDQGLPHFDPTLRAITILHEISEGVNLEQRTDGRWFRVH